MKSKSLIKAVTLVFFFSLLSFFVLFQSGFIVRRGSAEMNYSELLAQKVSAFGDSLKQKKFGLSTFQKLQLRGAFDPENFDAMLIPYPVSHETHLSSSKSVIIKWDQVDSDTGEYLKSIFKSQFQQKKEKK